MYAEVTVVVEGALEEVVVFHDYAVMGDWIGSTADDLQGDGVSWAIYVQYHEHAEGIECECAQYETDHRPYLSSQEVN